MVYQILFAKICLVLPLPAHEIEPQENYWTVGRGGEQRRRVFPTFFHEEVRIIPIPNFKYSYTGRALVLVEPFSLLDTVGAKPQCYHFLTRSPARWQAYDSFSLYSWKFSTCIWDQLSLCFSLFIIYSLLLCFWNRKQSLHIPKLHSWPIFMPKCVHVTWIFLQSSTFSNLEK